MKITVFQDTYCPWCYIGKRNLEKAVDEFDGDVDIEYRSFFLNPNTPKEGMSKQEYLQGRYDPQHFAEMEKHLEIKAEAAGINMQFTEDQPIPNTLLSHRLGKLYPQKKHELIQKYYEAYFERSVDIGKIDNLLDIAESVGIDPEEARFKLLGTDEKTQEVFDDYHKALQIGVRGVPFFVFNGEVAIQGAHEPNMILQVMRRIQARESIQFDTVND